MLAFFIVNLRFGPGPSRSSRGLFHILTKCIDSSLFLNLGSLLAGLIPAEQDHSSYLEFN